MQPFNPHIARKDFPALAEIINDHPLIYLDSAATTLKPLSVLSAMDHFYRHEYGAVHRALHSLSARATARYHAARDAVKEFIHAAHAEEIIFTKGTTESINLVAASFGDYFINKGDCILLSDIEHHSNIVPWQWLSARKGATIQWIRTHGGIIDLDHLKELLNDSVKLVSLAHISNTFGGIQPIREIADLVHAQGGKLLVDGAQSAPHIPVDVQALDVDFFAFSGHKLYGPSGIGVLYGKKDLLEVMPPYQGGGDMIDLVGKESSTYNKLPYKFEAGTPNSAGAVGLHAAIDYLQQWGLSAISDYEDTLLRRLVDHLTKIPRVHFAALPHSHTGLVSLWFEGAHPMDVACLLDLKGIAVRSGHLCSQHAMKRVTQHSLLRVSLGLYNTLQEVDAFSDALENTLKRL